MLELQYRILDPRVHNYAPPSQATMGSAGFDLRAFPQERYTLHSGDCALIPTGIAIHISDPSIVGLIVPRSGLGHKGLVLGNLIGVIDSDYQGELKLSCWNRSQESQYIDPGDRIAQLLLMNVIRPQFQRVESFDLSARGAKSFGHSGLR